MEERLFVYGSLCPGRPNEHRLIRIGGTWQKATAHGHLKEAGWGADMGFPGIIPDPAGDPVPGYIFCSENLAAYWEELDSFEGAEYQRVLTYVTTEQGESVQAFIYALRLEQSP